MRSAAISFFLYIFINHRHTTDSFIHYDVSLSHSHFFFHSWNFIINFFFFLFFFFFAVFFFKTYLICEYIYLFFISFFSSFFLVFLFIFLNESMLCVRVMKSFLVIRKKSIFFIFSIFMTDNSVSNKTGCLKLDMTFLWKTLIY